MGDKHSDSLICGLHKDTFHVGVNRSALTAYARKEGINCGQPRASVSLGGTRSDAEKPGGGGDHCNIQRWSTPWLLLQDTEDRPLLAGAGVRVEEGAQQQAYLELTIVPA